MSASQALSSSIYINPKSISYEYQPKYCPIEYVGKLIHEFSADTVPPLPDVIDFIRQYEGEIDRREWGWNTQVDELIDGQHEIISFQWYYVGYFAQVFYPRHTNILRVIKCYWNRSGSLTQDPSWTEVMEGPGTGSSFITLRKAVGETQMGQCLLFYSNTPFPGPQRIRLTYEYGMNMPLPLLREYAGKLTGMSCIEAKAAKENINVNTDKGPWAALHRQWKERTLYLRSEIFPKKTRKVYIL